MAPGPYLTINTERSRNLDSATTVARVIKNQIRYTTTPAILTQSLLAIYNPEGEARGIYIANKLRLNYICIRIRNTRLDTFALEYV